MKKILVIGGAGYIGSHMVLSLQDAGYHPIVLDNFCTGHADAFAKYEGAIECIEGNFGDEQLLEKIFSTQKLHAIMHFAASIEVAESVINPLKYYKNNVANTLTLFSVMAKYKIKNLIFSSTAAVYGVPSSNLISETHLTQPINPYGRSKLMLETIIQDLGAQGLLNYYIFRYFNAAGADPLMRCGERHIPETHLIPLALEVASGALPLLNIYGQDYPTPDGTCIRDFIHVKDVCEAHLLGLNNLQKEYENKIYNLGTGEGHSVLEIIQTAKNITGSNIPLSFQPPRAGDPAILVADPSNAKRELNWYPRYSELPNIIKTAWQFGQAHTNSH